MYHTGNLDTVLLLLKIAQGETSRCVYLCAAHSAHVQVTEPVGIVVICPPTVWAWGQKSSL